MAPRANWKGYLRLSLVSCPVALYPASSTSSRISFNTLNRKTGNKVRRIYIDPDTEEEVPPEDQVKGYPVSKHEYVTVADDEIDRIRIESSHTIDIEKFVPRAQIDPRYMDAPYYIVPEDRVGQEAFAVIRDAMRNKEVVAIGRVVISRRERVMMIEPWDKGLLGTTLRYGYEVRDPRSYFEDIPDMDIAPDMHDMAEVIVQRKLADWNPADFQDRYEDAVTDLIRSKKSGVEPTAPEAPRASNVVNLMQALRDSIERERGAPAAAPARKGKAAAAAPAAEERPMAPSKPRKGAQPAKAPANGTRQAGGKARKA